MAHFLIVAADYYQDVTHELLLGAKTHLDVCDRTYEIIIVPGAFEIPGAISLANHYLSNVYDGYVALGCVIRGETSHYDHVCNECARGIQDLAVNHQVPIGFGVLTVESKEQANYRASVNVGNKGKEAAEASMKMVALKQRFEAAS